MRSFEIFIDESGDFGRFDKRCPFYLVTLVKHPSDAPILPSIGELEYRLSLLSFENAPVHTTPAIRGEEDYFNIDLATRRRILSAFAAFMRKSPLSYRTICVEKKPCSSPGNLSDAISSSLRTFLATAKSPLSSDDSISVIYDKGQHQLSRIIDEAFGAPSSNLRFMRTLPVYARLSQAADYACTIERIATRISCGLGMTHSEAVFFGSEKRFAREWLNPLRNKTWA